MKKPRRISVPKHLKWFGQTDRGKVRKNNEDAFLGLQFDAREVHLLGKIGEAEVSDKHYVFAVSDGMGGALAGEYASRIAIEKITKLLPASFNQSELGLEAEFAETLTELFSEIHRALAFVGSSYEECAGMETTLTLCWFTPGLVYYGHIGDSRLYHLPARQMGLKQLSQDDTYVGWQFRNGQINEREARTHPRRNVLQKALGGGNQFVDPQVGAVAYEPGDIFLLCTDGLVEGLYDQELLELLRPSNPTDSANNPAQKLVNASVEKDGRDNTTALVIEAT